MICRWCARKKPARRQPADCALALAAAPLDWKQYAVAAGCAGRRRVCSTLVLAQFTGPRVPGFIFLLAVVLLALFLGRGPVLFAGAASALAWNYFFLPPKFTFIITSTEDGVLFGLYFVVAIVLGQLVARIRAQELAERRREERATALYQLTRELAQAGTRDEVVWQLVARSAAFFRRRRRWCCPAKMRWPSIPTVRWR